MRQAPPVVSEFRRTSACLPSLSLSPTDLNADWGGTVLFSLAAGDTSLVVPADGEDSPEVLFNIVRK